MNEMIYFAARFLANALNPTLILLLLSQPIWDRRHGERITFGRSFAIRLGVSALSLAIAVPLAELGKHEVVWSGHPLFPSGHMTFATTTGMCFLLPNRDPLRAAAVAGPLVALMGWALVHAGFHDSADVMGALALGACIGIAAILTMRYAEPQKRGTPPRSLSDATGSSYASDRFPESPEA